MGSIKSNSFGRTKYSSIRPFPAVWSMQRFPSAAPFCKRFGIVIRWIYALKHNKFSSVNLRFKVALYKLLRQNIVLYHSISAFLRRFYLISLLLKLFHHFPLHCDLLRTLLLLLFLLHIYLRFSIRFFGTFSFSFIFSSVNYYAKSCPKRMFFTFFGQPLFILFLYISEMLLRYLESVHCTVQSSLCMVIIHYALFISAAPPHRCFASSARFLSISSGSSTESANITVYSALPRQILLRLPHISTCRQQDI